LYVELLKQTGLSMNDIGFLEKYNKSSKCNIVWNKIWKASNLENQVKMKSFINFYYLKPAFELQITFNVTIALV